MKPWQIVKVKHEDYSHWGETVSYPTPEQTIMVRMVPGDSGTMREMPLKTIEPAKIKIKWVYYAEVSGQFAFPVDMLRYDFCAPRNFTLSDGEVILNDLNDTKLIVARATERKHPEPFTVARWKSFSWNVTQLRTLKYQPNIS